MFWQFSSSSKSLWLHKKHKWSLFIIRNNLKWFVSASTPLESDKWHSVCFKSIYTNCANWPISQHPINGIHYFQPPILASDLPRAADWTWNQSNARQTFNLEQGVTVTLRKVSPRIRNLLAWLLLLKFGSTRLTSLLLPIFILIGARREQISMKFGPIQWEQKPPLELYTLRLFLLDSLSFLLPFVNVDTAKELGWLYNYN